MITLPWHPDCISPLQTRALPPLCPAGRPEKELIEEYFDLKDMDKAMAWTQD